jgi:hypothetical protein
MESGISLHERTVPLVSTLYLVPHGIDRVKTGRALAAPILSDDPAAAARVLRGVHPDLIELSAPDGKQKIGISQVREVIRQAAFVATQARRKVCMVPQAEAMTPEAANALLKILEEPPRELVFLLLAEQQGDLLPTIVSRSRVARLHTDGTTNGQAQLEAAGYTPDDGRLVLALVRDDAELATLLEAPIDTRAVLAQAIDEASQAQADQLLDWSVGDQPFLRRASLVTVFDRLAAGDRALAVQAARSFSRLDLETLRELLEELAAILSLVHRRRAVPAGGILAALPVPATAVTAERARDLYRRVEHAWQAVSHHTSAEAVLVSLFLALEGASHA